MSSTKHIVTAKGLHRWLGEGAERVHVLRGVNLALETGKTYAIVGPSGCGKSTLLYILGLLDQPDGGEVTISGQNVDLQSDEDRTRLRRERLGFVFQFHFLLSEFSALENLLLPIRRRQRRVSESEVSRASELLDAVGLGDKLNRNGNQLSGGERQRVAVARALANNPSLVLADEPTGNLDAANSDALFDLFQRLSSERNQTFLIVTHNPELAARCDHTLRMRDGLFLEESAV